jgi:hypothetical protein
MEHQAADYSDKKCNSAVISMFDRATQYKRERDDARRENGELRAKVALLSQMLEDIAHTPGIHSKMCGHLAYAELLTG